MATDKCQISLQILIHCLTHHSCRMTASNLTWSQSKWTSAEPSLESDDTPGDALLRHRHPSPPIGRNKTSQDWSDFSCLGLLIRPLQVCYWPADADFESTSPFEALRLETQEGKLQAPALNLSRSRHENHLRTKIVPYHRRNIFPQSSSIFGQKMFFCT